MDLPPAFTRSVTYENVDGPAPEFEEHAEGFFSSMPNDSIYDEFVDFSYNIYREPLEFVDPSNVFNTFTSIEPLEPLEPVPPVPEGPLQVVIVCVVDRSGSMEASLPKLMRTLQEVMQDQHALYPTADVCLTDFNCKVFQHPVKPIESVVKDGFPPLKAEGSTAYYDAAHTTILNILQKYSNEVKKVFITLTDGEDNASSVSERSVYDLIKFAEKRNSSFIYLGSSKEILLNGDHIGIKAQIEFDQLNVNIPQLRRGITEEVSRGISLSQNTAD